MTADEIPKEKQIRAMEISMTPALVTPFAIIFYFLYLKTMGVEVPAWVLANYLLFGLSVSLVVCLTLNEALLRVSGGRFKFRRLVFRWTLLTSYFFLIWVVFFFLTMLFPWAETFFQYFFGMLIGTAIFVIIILRFRHLFSTLDKGEW